MTCSKQRLEDEYDSNVIITAPTVPYRGELMPSNSQKSGTETLVNFTNGQTIYISNPTEFPDANDRARVKNVEEPMGESV